MCTVLTGLSPSQANLSRKIFTGTLLNVIPTFPLLKGADSASGSSPFTRRY